jgi:hypothetical protein
MNHSNPNSMNKFSEFRSPDTCIVAQIAENLLPEDLADLRRNPRLANALANGAQIIGLMSDESHFSGKSIIALFTKAGYKSLQMGDRIIFLGDKPLFSYEKHYAIIPENLYKRLELEKGVELSNDEALAHKNFLKKVQSPFFIFSYELYKHYYDQWSEQKFIKVNWTNRLLKFIFITYSGDPTITLRQIFGTISCTMYDNVIKHYLRFADQFEPFESTKSIQTNTNWSRKKDIKVLSAYCTQNGYPDKMKKVKDSHLVNNKIFQVLNNFQPFLFCDCFLSLKDSRLKLFSKVLQEDQELKQQLEALCYSKEKDLLNLLESFYTKLVRMEDSAKKSELKKNNNVAEINKNYLMNNSYLWHPTKIKNKRAIKEVLQLRIFLNIPVHFESEKSEIIKLDILENIVSENSLNVIYEMILELQNWLIRNSVNMQRVKRTDWELALKKSFKRMSKNSKLKSYSLLADITKSNSALISILDLIFFLIQTNNWQSFNELLHCQKIKWEFKTKGQKAEQASFTYEKNATFMSNSSFNYVNLSLVLGRLFGLEAAILSLLSKLLVKEVNESNSGQSPLIFSRYFLASMSIREQLTLFELSDIWQTVTVSFAIAKTRRLIINRTDYLKDIVDCVNHTRVDFFDFTKPREQAYFLLKCALEDKNSDPLTLLTEIIGGSLEVEDS